MNINAKIALGIDITENKVNLALLKKSKTGIKLVKAVSIALAPGVIVDGRVEDHLALAKTIKTAKSTNKIKTRASSVSLCAEPSLLQILELPKAAPVNVRKYVQDEIKQYAVLPLKNIEMDYCASGSNQFTNLKQILMCAAKIDEMVLSVRKFEKEHLNVRRIEPAILGYLRACYKNIAAPAKNKNLLLVMIRDSILTLCVFRNNNIEFLRTRKLENLHSYLEQEIHSVLQYYDLEVQNIEQSWQITLFTNGDEIDDETADKLKDGLSSENLVLHISGQQDLCGEIEIKDNTGYISPVAVGLAMKILEPDSAGHSLNLLPKEILAYHKAKGELLLIANVAAVILLIIFLKLGLLTSKSLEIDEAVAQTKQISIEDDMRSLLESQKTIKGQIEKTQLSLDAMEHSGKPEVFVSWAKVLAELGSNIPKNVQIQNISVENSNSMELEGIAVSYKAVNAFAKLLNECKSIDSVLLTGSNMDINNSGLVDYSITCEITK
ncbi:MAG: pilus assembly protein PilM [Anaerohalosphaeraceae bacterium]|nr:pilus assembly protein PilM [Anaerohalosphaeraceae bacterium]